MAYTNSKPYGLTVFLFTLSFRDIEELLATGGIIVTYKTICQWYQKRLDKKAAKRFFKKLLKGQQVKSFKIVSDKLRSYSAAKREVMPSLSANLN